MDPNNHTPLRAVALDCTLSPSAAPSSSQLLAEQTVAASPSTGSPGRMSGSPTTA